jgi:RNA recognition motif-containing protein
MPAGQPTAGQSSIPPSSNGHKPAPQSVRLFVGGLPADITVAELQSRFKPFGTVLGMEVVPLKDVKGACRGFAYVDLDPISEASLHKCFTVVRDLLKGIRHSLF